MESEKLQLFEELNQLKMEKDIILTLPPQKNYFASFSQWRERGIKAGSEYAILTDEITKAWSGMTTRQYKNLKGLKKESLRDNMSTLELALNTTSGRVFCFQNAKICQ